MRIIINHYLDSTFPGLELAHSIFNQWDIGIHFELGKGMYQLNDDGSLNMDMFHLVYQQSFLLFHELFSYRDDILLVTNLYQNASIIQKKRTKIYDRYVKNKELKYQINLENIPYIWEVEEEKTYTTRLSLQCRKADIKYKQLIKAACNEDFPLQPKLARKSHSLLLYPDLFFINLSKNLIFFIYDDRGCEVIAKDKETLIPLYEKYGDWIDEFSREKVDSCFRSKGE